MCVTMTTAWSHSLSEHPPDEKKKTKFPDRLLRLLREMFGPANVNWNWSFEGDKIEVTVDSNTAILDPGTLVSVCVGGREGCV